jgi:molybdenum cofactor cytidylyltransferase
MRFSAVVLAAGISSRMQGTHKMLLPIGAEPVIRRTVRQVLAANPQEVVVVTGHNGRAVIEALIDLPVSFQPNPRYQEGQMISVALGAGALRQPTDAVMICLGDMVLLRTEDYREVVDAFTAMPRGSILVPRHHGQRGNPVVFAAHHAPEVMSGEKNVGCRKLIADHPEEVFAYEAAHDRYTTDMDTPEDYAAILVRLALAPTETA